MVLILALSMVAYVVNGILALCAQIDFLAQHNLIIRSGDVAVFPEFSIATLGDLINIASQIIFQCCLRSHMDWNCHAAAAVYEKIR